MEAVKTSERYEATTATHNPAYIPDEPQVYTYDGRYNQKQLPDTHRNSFPVISHEKNDERSSKEHRSVWASACLGAAFLVIALVIGGAVAIAVITVVVDDDVKYPKVLVVGVSSTKGEITLSNATWNTNLENSSSEQYKNLESEFIEEMDRAYRASNLANVYNRTTVEQFRPGSIIVVFVVYLNGATPSARQVEIGNDINEVQNEVEQATSADVLSVLGSETNNGYLGDLLVGEPSITEVFLTIEVEDGNSGNQPSETEPPSVICPADITQNTDDEQAYAVVSWEEPVAEDNSGVIDRIEALPESGSEFMIGEIEVTVLAYDGAGNIGLCTFTVTVIDEELPSVSCPSNRTENVPESEATKVVTWPPPEVADNSGEDLSVETTPPSGHAFTIGVTSVEVTVSDLSGNTASCTFFVNILDGVKPVLTCPPSITVDTDPGQPTGNVTWSAPSATDNSGQAVMLTSDLQPGDYDIGQHVVTYTGEDTSGNTAQCSFTVTVRDGEKPVLTCPPNITVDTDPGQPTGNVTWSAPSATDNSGQVVMLTSDLQPGDYDIGQHVVTYTGEDTSGNTAQCSFTVTVTDGEKPALTCPPNITVDTDPGQPTGNVTWSAPSATDNSGQVVMLTSDLQPGDYDIGQHVVTYTGEDTSGNTAQCSFTVTVTDGEKPALTCPPNITVDTDPGQPTGNVTWSAPSATDNSGQVVMLTSDLQPGDYDIGQHVVTYTGEDTSGNTAQCSFTVTVTDGEKPVLTCPPNITVDTDPGQPTGNVTWSAPSATDNSGQAVMLTSDLQPGDYDIGQHVVTYTGEDTSGNTAQCSFTVTVTDSEAPVINCPSDIYNKTQMGEFSGYVTWTISPPTDNSGGSVTLTTDYQPGEFAIGSYTVNATAIDESENTAWCTFEFVVEPLCHPEFCLNEGNCSFSSLENDYVCQCPEGTLGKNCEFEVPGPDECGTNPLFPSTRIVGGVAAQPGSWPWQAFLAYRSYLCGAILVTNQWLLTAAHCVGDPGARANLEAVVLGEAYLNNVSESHINRPVERIIVHPGYQTITLDNDIALLQLTEPVDVDDFVRPACLPSDRDIIEDKHYSNCYITGWGRTEESGNIAMQLQQAQVPLINRTVCDQQLKALGILSITENMLCAGFDEGMVSTCQFNKFPRLFTKREDRDNGSVFPNTQGDSGGPLVCQEMDGRWSVVGITSWGYQCGAPESPSVFVRVSKYLDYIESVIHGNPVVSCEPINSGCMMNVPYTETFSTTQSQIEYFVNSLYYTSPGIGYPVCDMKELNATLCGFFFKGCDQAIVPCRQYCESVQPTCLQSDYFCTFMPYGPPGEKWCLKGSDYCGEQNIWLSEDSSKALRNPFLGNFNLANRDCIWFITAPVGYDIIVRVQFLSISSFTHTLSVGSGRDPDRRSSTVVKLYDQTQTVVVEDHEGWIRLETDNFEAYSGFSAILMTTDKAHADFPCKEDSLNCSGLCLPEDWLCDGIRDCLSGEDENNCTIKDFSLDVFLTEDDPVYFIKSPGYPHYPPNLNATWSFMCPEGFVIRITFLMVDIQSCCDIITVRDGTGQSLLEWSGYVLNEKPSVTSRGNKLLVSFQTDDFAEMSGFLADVQLLNGTNDDVFDCGERYDCGQGVCIPFSGVCNDVINCLEGVDETCSESIFVNSSFIFNSPNYPSAYPSSFRYTWYFSTFPGSQLLVTFNTIATEPGYDYVYVREGSNISAGGDLLLRWSGLGFPDQLRILSLENIIWVTFESDELIAYNGFEATVEVTNVTRKDLNCSAEFNCGNGVCLPQSKVCDGGRDCANNADETEEICPVCSFFCNIEKCISSGQLCDGVDDCGDGLDEDVGTCGGDIFVNSGDETYLLSPNYPNYYPLNFSVTWNMSTHQGYIFRLQLISFQTEFYNDFITVDEFDDINFTQLIKKWSGNDISLQVLTSTNQMRVSFYSDETFNDEGFLAAVTSVPGNATSSCPVSYFDCGNGACFSMEAGCDLEVNCGNDADAEPCTVNPDRCDVTQFSCSDMCIENELVCDNTSHCLYSEDEASFCDEVIYIPENTIFNITSPDYPSPYPDGSSHTWYLRTDPGIKILVYFSFFATEESYDFVTIGDGLQGSSHLLLKWSGYDPSVSVLSASNHLWFNFQSDVSTNDFGFEAVVYAVKVPANDSLECEDYQISCGGSVCLPSAALCDGVESCGTGEDEETCTVNTTRCDVTEFRCHSGDICIINDWVCDGEDDCPESEDELICDEVIYIPENTIFNITSPDYPSPYPNNSSHTWYLSTDPGINILVYFLSFATEEFYDFVTIGDGLQASSHLLLKWSGDDPSVSVLSASNHLWFNFQSDDFINDAGFEAVAYAVQVAANDSLECEDYQFSCGGSVCLPSTALCDGVVSCGSEEDENNCTAPTCPDGSFECFDGTCVPYLLLCDGIPHCTTGEDEAAILCGNETDQCSSVPAHCQQYLPYNTTRFPHQFAANSTSAEETFWKLMPYLSCHDNATAFVCAALYPDCQDIGVTVEPCNTTCLEVVQNCEPVYFNGTEELWPFTCFHYGNYHRQDENGFCHAVQYLASVSGYILMNGTFSEDLSNTSSDAYQNLTVQFISESDSLFSSSILLSGSYLGTKIDGFSAGSINISFQVFLNQLVDGDNSFTATVIHVTMQDAIDFQTHYQTLPLLSDTLTTYPATVMDNVPPRILSCPDNIAMEAGNEESIFVSWDEPFVSDNSGSWLSVEGALSLSSFFPVDTVTDIQYIYADPSGNQATCEFTVAILPPSCNPMYVDLIEGQVVNISTPFYPEFFPRGIICRWNFTAPTGLVVLIEFDVFQLGTAQVNTAVGNFTGFQIPAPLISSTSQLSIVFTSRQFTYPGFHATVKAVNASYYSDIYCDNGGQVILQDDLFCDGTDNCLDASDENDCACTENDIGCYDSNNCVRPHQRCDGIRDCPLRDDEINCHPNCSAGNITLVSNQSIWIQSNNFPGFYFPKMDCAWMITAPENHSIIIRTSFLEIGEEDFITIGKGQNFLNTSNTLNVLKGDMERDVAVDGRYAWIRFSSGEGVVTKEGFRLDVVALNQEDFARETFQCYSGRSIVKSEVCDGVNDCPDFADEDGCPPCLDISQAECQSLLPYQETIFPHPLAESPDDANSVYSHLSFLTGCHPSVNILLCSVLFPDCPHTGPVTRPCQSFCLNVTDSCKALYESTTASPWPINCENYDDNLPVGNDGFCNGGEGDIFNTEICGTRPASPMRGRIVGGTEASFGDWPWIASLRDEYGSHQCGATLITERWAITAAHCIGYVFTAVFGDLYLSLPSPYHHETTFTPYSHPQYNPYTKEHDIALLELHQPVNFSNYVRPSCLTTLTNETDVYTRCYIAGWGHLMYEASTVPDRLQEALTHLFTADECRYYISSNYQEDTMLCAGYDEGGIDTCQGDSGGPLVCEGSDGRWHLVGVTSFGFACALPELPGVYTRISQHLDFIQIRVG